MFCGIVFNYFTWSLYNRGNCCQCTMKWRTKAFSLSVAKRKRFSNKSHLRDNLIRESHLVMLLVITKFLDFSLLNDSVKRDTSKKTIN